MPGLAGIINFRLPEEIGGVLRSMVESMQHEPGYVTGMCREPRLHLAAGWAGLPGSISSCLPVWNDRKDIWLLLCGEDFTDHSAGAREPGAETANFLLHLYEQRGREFLAVLNGRCSGLVADFRRQELLLFNDRYGLNRIYFHEAADGFYFASEAKALLAARPGLRELAPQSLGEFFSCGCTLENRTLFPGIAFLPPASAWTFGLQRPPLKETYFRLEISEPPFSHREYIKRLQETFPRVLQRYFRPPGQVALSLTGGLDSRMIVAHAPRSLPCYTFGGMYRDCNDVRIARRVARIWEQPHTTIPIDGKFLAEFPALAAKTVLISDGTMDVTGAVELQANRLARELAPIRLTGSYGGEVLRGLVAFKPRSTSLDMLHPDLAPHVHAALDTYQRIIQGPRLPFILFRQMPWHHYGRSSIEQSQLMVRSPYLDNDLVALAARSPDFTSTHGDAPAWLSRLVTPPFAGLATDRGVAAHAFPAAAQIRRFWQNFTFKAEYAYDYGMPQWLVGMDQLLAPLRLERLFLGRHKFYHFRIWYRDQLADFVQQVLLDPAALNRPWINRRRVEELVNGHVAGRLNATTQIHQLLTLELIHRQLLTRG